MGQKKGEKTSFPLFGREEKMEVKTGTREPTKDSLPTLERKEQLS